MFRLTEATTALQATEGDLVGARDELAAALYAATGARPPRPGGGVAIRLVDGAEVAVPRQQLEVLPPDHPLVPVPDGTQASWWLEQLEPWGRDGIPVNSFVPSSFPAVCHVLHRWRAPDGAPVRWATLAEHPGLAELRDRYQTRDGLVAAVAHEHGFEASTGELDEFTVEALVEVLASATTTPDDVFVAIWEGRGDVPAQRFPGAARIDTFNRGHFLLRGPLTGALSSVAASGRHQPTSGLWWPADRAWFVATEIDFEWTFVVGEPSLIDRLHGDPRLEVAETTFEAPAGHVAELSGPRRRAQLTAVDGPGPRSASWTTIETRSPKDRSAPAADRAFAAPLSSHVHHLNDGS